MITKGISLSFDILLGLIMIFIIMLGIFENVHSQERIDYSEDTYYINYGSHEDLIRHQEHCSVTQALATDFNIQVGSQIRVKRECDDCNLRYALYTVSIIENENEVRIIRMGRRARMRLNPTGDRFYARISTNVVHPVYDSEQQAKDHDELVENLEDDGLNTQLIVIAPHGGAIEGRTDDQARRVADNMGNDCSFWACYGYNSDPDPEFGAYASWHITSTELDEAGFPRLNQIFDRDFEYAVAFHGYTADGKIVIIGGACEAQIEDISIQEVIARHIRENTNNAVTVIIAEPGDPLGGFYPDNIVNRLAGNGGVQLEQSYDARKYHGNAIADAVAEAFEALLNHLNHLNRLNRLNQ